MRKGYRSRWLLLLASLGAMPGCARSTIDVPYPPHGPDPRVLVQTGALEADWTKMARASEAQTNRGVGVAPAARQPADSLAARPREGPQEASSSAADGPGPPLRKSLWDKQLWEVELDKTVRAVCRGC
jgi:hypothetical protein